ncbi:hypothetical protein QN277_016112 [Acacia crassicarpa]|uniref:25S rRNA (uridine-N(3))-methyltransferase BMT5-like domain-containing protein n=1 Tax=Acacia crassicarpa TaxID=499986 RepID=A0AAE1MVY4_9FABA|nr:hypothetical protein QN277_016112 [Acacia crassicarpa]
MTLQMSCKSKRKKLVGLSDYEEEEKWLKYYSSHHQILLVDEVVRKYKKGMPNLVALRNLGAYVLHEVDATQMKSHPDLKMRRFDRIIFNFPHAGFHGREGSFSMIQKHKDLIRGFFKNASSMLSSIGEVHINHKITPPFDDWCIKELGIQNLLLPIECVEFKKEDYPGYNNKRGDGSRCDQPFPLGKCSTFKFVLLTKKQSNPSNQRILSNHHYPLRSLSHQLPPSVISCRNGHLPTFGGGGYLNSEKEILGRTGSGYVGGISHDLQRSCWPESTESRHPEREHVRNMIMTYGKQDSGYVDGSICDLQRSWWPESTVFGHREIEPVRNMVRRYGNISVMLTNSDLQRSSWPESTEFRYQETEHARNMVMIRGRSLSEYVGGISSDLQM